MPFVFDNWRGETQIRSASEAVQHAVGSAGLLSSGQLETLRAEHERLVEIVGRLVEQLPNRRVAADVIGGSCEWRDH